MCDHGTHSWSHPASPPTRLLCAPPIVYPLETSSTDSKFSVLWDEECVDGQTDGWMDGQRDGGWRGGQTGLSQEMRLGLVIKRRKLTPQSLHLVWTVPEQLGAHRPTTGADSQLISSRHRNIAKVASQVHAFQENPYTFAPDPKLQSYLKQRIARFSGADISALAADSRASSHHVASEKHCRKIQDKLRRMKATFQ